MAINSSQTPIDAPATHAGQTAIRGPPQAARSFRALFHCTRATMDKGRQMSNPTTAQMPDWLPFFAASDRRAATRASGCHPSIVRTYPFASDQSCG